MMQLAFLVILLVSNVNSRSEDIWIELQLFRCTEHMTSGCYSESINHLIHCVTTATVQCQRDNANYSKHIISFKYYCGYIDSTNLIFVPTTWTIKGFPTIRLTFYKFLLKHLNWYCRGEFLSLSTANTSDQFCGHRAPWTYYPNGHFLKKYFFQKIWTTNLVSFKGSTTL